MKIRNGFVSNSSSSSFLVAVKKTDKCPTCGQSPLDVYELLGTGGCDESRVSSRGKKAILDEIKEWFEFDEDPNGLLKKVTDWDEDIDGELGMISIAYGSESLYELIKNLSNVTILEDLN